MSGSVADRHRDRLPAAGVKAALAGGNTVGAAVREAKPRSDGYRHIDTPALIDTLTRLGANTYFYGIWDSPTDWEDLRTEFAPAAQRAGIQIWPYIVPPSETSVDGRASRPFMTDYIAWAEAIANLSRQYDVLVAWAIDDFEFDVNSRLFTPTYMARIRAAQDAINPSLGFYTCAYFGEATNPAFLDRHQPYIDGIVYPFLDGNRINTHVSETAGADLDAILAETEKRGLGLLQLVYAGRFLDAPLTPTEHYVDEAVSVGLDYTARGAIAGVIAYGLQTDDAPTLSSDNKAMYGTGRLSLVTGRRPIHAGSYSEAKQTITVDPDARRHELSFWHHRAFTPSVGGPGQLAISVHIDDEEVWNSDVTDEPWLLWMQGDSFQGPVELTKFLAGKTTAELAFRLRALSDVERFPVDVGIDQLESVGFDIPQPDFESPDGWRLSATGDATPPAIEQFVPDRPRRIFTTVANHFTA